MMRRSIHNTGLIFVALIVSACAKDPAAEDRSNVQFSVNEITVTRPGVRFIIQPDVWDRSGGLKPAYSQSSIIWSSSNESVATVTQGQINTFATGETTISVKFNEKSDSFVLRVTQTESRITGHVSYQDRMYDEDLGLAEWAQKAVRNAEVELLDASGHRYDSSQTDAQGDFSFGHIIPDPFVIRALAKPGAQYSQSTYDQFNIFDLQRNTFAARSRSYSAREAAGMVDFKITGEVSGAFNILDVLMNGAAYVTAHLDTQMLIDTSLDSTEFHMPLDVYWEKNNALGTFFCNRFSLCPYGPSIFILNNELGLSETSSRQSDEFDDDVILHEYFHFIQDRVFHSDSRGGCHSSRDNRLDLRLSWGEGSASYFAISVKKWLWENGRMDLLSHRPDPDGANLDILLDSGEYGAPYGVDIGLSGDKRASPDYRKASNEIAVAHILSRVRNIYGHGVFFLALSHKMTTGQGHTHVPGEIEAITPANLELYWDGLMEISGELGLDLLTLERIFAERGVLYRPDSFETNNTLFVATDYAHIEAAQLTLYQAPGLMDEDYIRLPVLAGKTYTVRTWGLSNGADTLLELYSADSPFSVAVNDNITDDYIRLREEPDDLARCQNKMRVYNDADSLASGITFQAAYDGEYYVRVSSAISYLSAARYGSYFIEFREK